MPGLLTLFTSKRTILEISDAKRELHLRKKLVSARRRMLRSHIRSALASKKALGVAGASGFMIGQLSQNRYCKDCGKAHTSVDASQIVRTGLRIYTLTQTANSLADFFTHD
ncbi:hypothetical protein [Aliidiomarina soli]|uniref:Uncharacterized protein n=1 Tax=Aliidiomarina soli TaxID=1928574 RepID=A0A432WL82_9GAMM|nr:hypothetical protein [Aliidiomarina soli]RUO34570.1 hypothetical protein CWE14_00790 [Aliidiomarina soli]